MADASTKSATTNTTPRSCVEVQCDCNVMWSMAQEYSYLRLSTATGPFKAKLIKSYVVRAKRIAATYARFYLELEQGGSAAYKGRFYWMALGAFASKTVACTLETWQVRGQALLFSATKEGLGKGNFWLFCDISGWHWYYSVHRDSFDTCLDRRNSDSYVPIVKAHVAKLPWSADALKKINRLAPSKEIRIGFAKVREYEATSSSRLKPRIQLQHLLAVADHEQGVILQPLIYDDPEFVEWLKRQRWPLVRSIAPGLELYFSHACSADGAALKSSAPSDTKLESFDSRMQWIRKVADQFHELMQSKPAYMEQELSVMAGWVSLEDG